MSQRWNKNTVLPSEKNGFTAGEESYFLSRRTCLDLAQNDSVKQREIWEKWTLTDIYEAMIDKIAYNW